MSTSIVATGPVTVRVSREFSVPPDRLFDTWFQPAPFASFLFAGAEPAIVRAHVEPRVGGEFVVVATHGPGTSLEVKGEYLEIERPERLVFAMEAEDDRSAPHYVTVELAGLGQGCLVALLHEMDMRYVAERPRVQRAWTAVLQRLADLAHDAGHGTSEPAVLSLGALESHLFP